MAKTRTKHSTSRAACQDLQKEACRMYSEFTGLDWGPSSDDLADIKPRQSAQPGVDVILSEKARNKCAEVGFPICCECKNDKQWALQKAVRQAMANTPEGQDWLLVLKRRSHLKKDRISPVVVMDLEAFKKLIIKLWE